MTDQTPDPWQRVERQEMPGSGDQWMRAWQVDRALAAERAQHHREIERLREAMRNELADDFASMRQEIAREKAETAHWKSRWASEGDARAQGWTDWTPTPENVNALPDALRSYIHQLHTACDPSGDTQARILAEDTCRAQELELAQRDETIRQLQAEVEKYECDAKSLHGVG